MPDPLPVRCAIYTRKSTEEGLKQEFNSLQAQREAAEAYILSQRQSGWTVIAEHYDDGGFSGADLDRPAMRKLLADVEAGRIDCVLVYKVDRLSRSLLDFARMMEMFDERGVSFVSVTQDFHTRSSPGRLTLNILLSFAQFEREIIGERTRDKLSAARGPVAVPCSATSWTRLVEAWASTKPKQHRCGRCSRLPQGQQA